MLTAKRNWLNLCENMTIGTVSNGCAIWFQGNPLERYRQLAITQNDKQNARLFVELTVYDTLKILKDEYKRLKEMGHSWSESDIARCYSELSGHRNSTIVQIANNVARLDDKVLAVTREVSNASDPVSVCRLLQSIVRSLNRGRSY